jgi:phage-related protein
VKTTFGEALMYAQCGEKHHKTKPLKHFGSSGVLEVLEDTVEGTFRLVYTVRFTEAVVVLHVFQKKSKTGIETSKQNKELINARIKLAEQVYKEWLTEKG